MKGGAALCLLAGLLWSLDLISQRALMGFTMTVGAAPMFLGLPGAWRRMRAGDEIGFFFLFSWFFSFGGAAVQGQLVLGILPANFWTLHSLQLGVTVDMLMFLRMISLRSKATREAMLRAEAEARMKSEFLANMSHEIRTPMNAIIGMSRLALMGEAPPRTRNYLNKILGAGEHLLGLVNDILDHAKMEAGKLAIEKLPFDLNALLEHLSSVTAMKSEAKGVELIFRVGAGVPQHLVGDPLRLGQVLVNLTGNAVKFTERGEIVVAVGLLEQHPGSVTLDFSVTDTGIGMTADQLGRLFQSFNQADSSTTRKYGGTGLGLSISRRLVELMGGDITVSSAPQVGSCFRFTVPLGVAAGPAGDGPLPQALLPDMRALVVDDSASARAALAEMLGALGVRADTAASGQEALALLARGGQEGHDYRFVLMDYLMPGLDGVETVRRMRKDAQPASLPAILMISAFTREAVMEEQGELPVDGFLHKPVGPALLYRSLLQVLHPEPGAGPAQGRLPVMAELPRLDGARILLAEDNANNREVALDFMAAARMQVDVAFNGRDAVRMALEGDYDLVLMDIQMPEMDGLGAAREIRTHAHLATLPIVAMTAHALPSDRALSRLAGMNDHVTKPIDPDLLFCTLLKWIDPARLQGRPLAPAGSAAAPAGAVPAPAEPGLPALPGIDWRLALESVGGKRSRLQKRAGSFVREYGTAPAILRDALESGDYPRLQSLAHNLKSSAAYVGAVELAGIAVRLEQDLRTGQLEGIGVQVPALVAATGTVLAGLARVAAATLPGPAGPDALAAVLGRLEGYLLSDDARAEDALVQLESLLAASGHAAQLADVLAALRRAVVEIEYAAALAPLKVLTAQLGIGAQAAAAPVAA